MEDTTGKIYTVSELTFSIKTLLEMQFRFVHLRGEISTLRTPFSGHHYFTLKDDKAQIKAVLFKGQQKYLHQPLQEGMSVVCHGRIGVYEPRGEYQIIVDTIDFSGKGDLHLQFEKLKKKLDKEGLFSSKHKRSLPYFPENIAVVTSPTGAAIHDFLTIAAKRKFSGKITVVPATVQGEKGPSDIAKGIEIAANILQADVIVIIRGGGSLEDLWCFNDEMTARAVFSSTVPVLTGIGHEIDYTIADMTADYSTHTPTAAAEHLIPDSELLVQQIQRCTYRLTDTIHTTLTGYQKEVESLVRIIGDLDLYLSHYTLKLDHQATQFLNVFKQYLAAVEEKAENQIEKLHSLSPSHQLDNRTQQLQYLENNLTLSVRRIVEKKESELQKHAALLDSVSPLAVLARGYSVTRTCGGAVVSSSDQLKLGDEVNVRLHRGEIRCRVTDIEGDEK